MMIVKLLFVRDFKFVVSAVRMLSFEFEIVMKNIEKISNVKNRAIKIIPPTKITVSFNSPLFSIG